MKRQSGAPGPSKLKKRSYEYFPSVIGVACAPEQQDEVVLDTYLTSSEGNALT